MSGSAGFLSFDRGRQDDALEDLRRFRRVGARRVLELLGSEVVDERGDEIEASCPVCGKECGHFYLNAESGLWVCFAGRHGGGGAIAALVAAALEISRPAARAWLASTAGDHFDWDLSSARARASRLILEEEAQDQERRANLPAEMAGSPACHTLR